MNVFNCKIDYTIVLLSIKLTHFIQYYKTATNDNPLPKNLRILQNYLNYINVIKLANLRKYYKITGLLIFTRKIYRDKNAVEMLFGVLD